MRGAYELIVLELKLAGRGKTCGAIAVFATGLATGAARLVTTREEPICMVALITCPAAVWTHSESAAIKQSTKNLDCFINCSAN